MSVSGWHKGLSFHVYTLLYFYTKLFDICFVVVFQGIDGLPGDKGDDGEAGQPVRQL